MIRNNCLKYGFALTSLLVLAACAHQAPEGSDHQHAERPGTGSPHAKAVGGAFDGKNSSFSIDGRLITLVNGASDEPIENSSAKMATRYIGLEARDDFDGDGLEDHAFVVSQTSGGSGTFYYVVSALQKAGGYRTTSAFLIGDRIQPESVEMRDGTGVLEVRYLDRKQGEPMAAAPSEEKVLLLRVGPNKALERLSKSSPPWWARAGQSAPWKLRDAAVLVNKDYIALLPSSLAMSFAKHMPLPGSMTTAAVEAAKKRLYRTTRSSLGRRRGFVSIVVA